MEKIKFKTKTKSFLADTITPVSVYMGVRDKYFKTFLLESSDYKGSENSFSFIGFEPIAEIFVKDRLIHKTYPDKTKQKIEVGSNEEVLENVKLFFSEFETDNQNTPANGFFGFHSFEAVKYFETLKLDNQKFSPNITPEIYYIFFKYIVAINHFKNELTIVENLQDGESSNIEEVKNQIFNVKSNSYQFTSKTQEKEYNSKNDFLEYIQKGKQHCKRGDVFQIVLSRKFSIDFKGDDFNVYRSLRHINPSPYLFYFDFGAFRIFGSSPEAQLTVKDRKVSINPIAGTYARTGDDKKDLDLAQKLSEDPKENAEHVMLVDLARNDLSINCENVRVEIFKEIQFYSHVIHIVSKVSGILPVEKNTYQIFADTFPAGTLSGAPKFKAMQLIDGIENSKRGFYGGAIGNFGLNGDINHAILIRSFLSENNSLFYQAGAGVVDKSVPESELKEVDNKLRALKKAVELAQNLR